MSGSPSGDFADQEFEDASEIGAFCQKNYAVEFPLTEKTSVRKHPDPLWQDLTSQPNSAPPNWNFTKYLVGADGHLIEHWGAKVTPRTSRSSPRSSGRSRPSRAARRRVSKPRCDNSPVPITAIRN